MKNHKLAIMSLLLAFIPALATALPPRPANCPGTRGIINSGLMSAELDSEDNIYTVGQIHTYETPETWAFVIAIPVDRVSKTNSIADALQKGRVALPSVSGSPTPLDINDHWTCMYNVGYGFQAIAVTPVDFGNTLKAAVR